MGRSLKNGSTKSCGCLRAKKITNENIGKVFGKLTIIGFEEKRTNDGHILYKCQCECGNIHYSTIGSLKSGHVSSCGCLTSKGEQEIEKILIENNISFKKQVSFSDLKGEKGGLLRFDFGIYQNDTLLYLIEFQGEQHYDSSNSCFDNPKTHDELKKQYCKENNIPLLAIPYWKRNNLTLNDLIPLEGE